MVELFKSFFGFIGLVVGSIALYFFIFKAFVFMLRLAGAHI